MNEDPAGTKRNRFARAPAAVGTWIILLGLLILTISQFARGAASGGTPALILPVVGAVLLALVCIVRVGEARRVRIQQEVRTRSSTWLASTPTPSPK